MTWDLSVPRTFQSVNSRLIHHLKRSPIEILLGVDPAPLQALARSAPSDTEVVGLIQHLDDVKNHIHLPRGGCTKGSDRIHSQQLEWSYHDDRGKRF